MINNFFSEAKLQVFQTKFHHNSNGDRVTAGTQHSAQGRRGSDSKALTLKHNNSQIQIFCTYRTQQIMASCFPLDMGKGHYLQNKDFQRLASLATFVLKVFERIFRN